MLPDNLKEHSAAVAVEAFDSDAVKGGKFDYSELTLDIAPAKIVSICGFLKYDQQFVRLSGLTAVDRYPAEPRFEVVYHLYSLRHRHRLRVKVRVEEDDALVPTAVTLWPRLSLLESPSVTVCRPEAPFALRTATSAETS